MEVRAFFGRFIWRGINIYDVTIHPSRSSRINPTLKVCEHNRAAHASDSWKKLHIAQWFIYYNGAQPVDHGLLVDCGLFPRRPRGLLVNIKFFSTVAFN